MQGTFQMTGGRERTGKKGMIGGGGVAKGAQGEGNKRLHNDCTMIQRLLKGDIPAIGEGTSLSSSSSCTAIHQRGGGQPLDTVTSVIKLFSNDHQTVFTTSSGKRPYARAKARSSSSETVGETFCRIV